MKGLEALEHVKDFIGNDYYHIEEEIILIEKELKRLEQLEIMYSNCVIEGAKQKKALEIIKNDCCIIQKGILPKEKQDLLDEVLLCH